MPSTCEPLSRDFFLAPPSLVAPALLGKLLICRHGRVLRRVRLVETEAYLGTGDRAAHSAAGRTRRNAVLFGPPGHAYVYFIYGMHYCLNVSTLPDGEAGGVLFRAAEEEGTPPRALSGPGRLTRALGIDRRDNGRDLTRPGSLYLADDGYRPSPVAQGPRIGIRHDAHLPLRFFLPGHPAVSRARQLR
ncbi:MAG TPA: DNA-3-methyladenine glycosylase [Terriglobales bacterium]|jgi:DNA-3-methyladenine glycosylase